MSERYAYTPKEELFNAVSHGVGTLLALVGGSVMVTLAACHGGWRYVISAVVYSLSLVCMYAMSTLYHAVSVEPVKRVLQILDHNSIYILIAGSYTPIMLVLLRDSLRGAYIFGAVWLLAILGVVLNAVSVERFKKLSLVLYVLMGWAVVFDMRAVFFAMKRAGLWLFFLGGASYTIGIIFYKLKRVRYMHGVWHLFVLLGSVLHYLCFLLYILLV